MSNGLPIGSSPSLPEIPAAGEARSWLDAQGLDSLKVASARDPHDPATLRAVAQQFESLFIGMMMKSMRDAKLGDGLFDSDQSRFYQDLFDQQLSVSLAQGRGLGIADMLVRSLSPTPPAAAAGLPAGAYGRAPRRAAAPGLAPLGSTAVPVGLAAPAPLADGESGSAAVAEAGGGVGVAAGGGLASTPEDFVALVMPSAEAAGAALGVSPLALVAQAALESNWGRQVPAGGGASSYNVFGIKADPAWPGRRVVKETVEFAGGVAERRREPFRAYESLTHGFADYVAFLQGNDRYAGALQSGADPEQFVTALHRAGYATDPAYSAKITAVLRSSTFRNAVAALKETDAPPIF